MMKVLRWVLFLPAAVVASIVGGFLGYLAGNIFGDIAMQTLATFLGTAAFVAVAGIVAPSHRSAVTITLTSIIVLVALTAFALSHFTDLEPYASMPASLKVLIPLAQMLGGVYAIFGIQQLFATKLDYLLRKTTQLVASVVLVGISVTIIGFVVGVVNHHWFGFVVGLGILVLGFLTWLLQRINLLFAVRRAGRTGGV